MKPELRSDAAVAALQCVEQTVRLVRLLERLAMREQRIDVEFVVDNKLCAFGLPDRAEGPGADHR